MPKTRVPIADGRALSSVFACALLAACATSQEPAAPQVVRTRAPQGYEKTINNYLAFRLRPQKNTRVSVAPPEPGDCPIDGTPSSVRGWVVPVTHETFSGELSGKDTIRITAKPYWFWFNGDTIAGIAPRADLCPGIVSAFDDPNKPRSATTAVEAPLVPVAARVQPAEPPRAPATTAKHTAKGTKKKATSSTTTRQSSAPSKLKEPAPPKPPE